VTVSVDPGERRDVTAIDATAPDGPGELESTLDEVITHLRDELRHGTWPAPDPDQE
jgi:hypothetical protein